MSYANDDEHEKAVQAAFGYFPTPEEDARDAMNADQRVAAMAESHRYHEMVLPSGEQHFGLYEVVKSAVDDVMREHRRSPLRKTEEWRPRKLNMMLRAFYEEDPALTRGFHVILADSPNVAHSMRYYDKVRKLLVREQSRHTKCYWSGDNVFCVGYSREFFCFSRGQYLVVFPTCVECKRWLL